MARFTYLDPALLAAIDAAEPARPDPRLVLAVRRALKRLPETQRDIVRARFIECLTFEQIGARFGLPRNTVRAEYYAAIGALRYRLTPFVEARWRIQAKGLCRICLHPKRGEIEGLLRAKDPLETWGAFGKRLERAIGEPIHPPRILITHLKHVEGADGRSTE